MMNKSVRFAEKLCLSYEGEVWEMDCSDNSDSDRWSFLHDMQVIKRRAIKLSKDERSAELSYLLSNAYARYDTKTVQSIHTWALSCEKRRGLERFVNKQFGVDRSDIQSRTVRAVLTAQKRMRKEGLKDKDHIANILCRLSETFSHDAAQFARILGNADALVAAIDSRNDEVKNNHYDDLQKIPNDRVFIRDAIVQSISTETVLSRKNHQRSVTPISSEKHFMPLAARRGINELQHFC